MENQPTMFSSCMERTLVKYERWGDDQWNVHEKYYSTTRNPILLRIEAGEMMIVERDKVLDTLSLTAGATQIKGIFKGPTLCIYTKHGPFFRKFRLKIAQYKKEDPITSCLNIVKNLRRFFYIKGIEEDISQTLDEAGEFVDIRPITWTNKNNFNIPETESILVASGLSDLEESVVATLMDPALIANCNIIRDVLDAW